MTKQNGMISVKRELLEEILQRLNVNQNHALCLNIVALLESAPCANSQVDPPAEDVRAVVEEPVAYTCMGKGGRYEILGLASGAGLTRGEDRLVYREISTNRLFLRTEADFSLRMTRLNK